MGGVDLSDQLRSYYPSNRKARKWWRYILFFLFDVSIVNAKVLESFVPNRSKRLLDFRLELVKGLVGNFSSRKQATPNQRVQQGHWPFLILKDGASGASRIIRLNGAQ